MFLCHVIFDTLIIRQCVRTSTVLSTLLFYSEVGPFFFRSCANLSARRESEKVDNFISPSPSAMSFSEVILSSAWVRSNVLASPTDFFHLLHLPSAFSVCLDADSIPNSQFPFCKKKRNTQVDATNHRHFFLDKHPFEGEVCRLVFSFPEGLFPVAVCLSQEFSRGEQDGREPFHFPFGLLLVLWIMFHSKLISSIALAFRLPSYAISTLPVSLPSDLPLAAVSPEARFSSCLSREEKCFSRFFRSRYRTTIVLESVVVSRFTFLNSILNVRRDSNRLSCSDS